jgi:uncharacterized protein YkwD
VRHHASPARPLLLRGSARAGRHATRHRGRRVALSAALGTAATALVLAVPVIAGTGATSPVVIGQDGGPLSARTFAGATTAATLSSTTGEASAAPSSTRSSSAPPSSSVPLATAPDGSGPAPAVPSAPADAPAEVVVPSEPAAESVTPESATPEAAAPAQAPASTAPASTAPASTAPAPAPAAAAAPASGSVESQVLALVNAERAAAGCGAVSAHGGLAAVALAHSADMRDRGFFDHVNLDGLDPFDRADRAGVSARAENIARGQDTPAEVMTGWMKSPGHRANILNCELTRLGVGVAQGSGGPWWTQLFG